MKSIKVNKEVRNINVAAGKMEGWTTPNFIKFSLFFAKNLNVGLNVLKAQSIIDVCDKALGDNSDVILMEDDHYSSYLADLKEINWKDAGLPILSFSSDIRNISEALDEKEAIKAAAPTSGELMSGS